MFWKVLGLMAFFFVAGCVKTDAAKKSCVVIDRLRYAQPEGKLFFRVCILNGTGETNIIYYDGSGRHCAELNPSLFSFSENRYIQLERDVSIPQEDCIDTVSSGEEKKIPQFVYTPSEGLSSGEYRFSVTHPFDSACVASYLFSVDSKKPRAGKNRNPYERIPLPEENQLFTGDRFTGYHYALPERGVPERIQAEIDKGYEKHGLDKAEAAKRYLDGELEEYFGPLKPRNIFIDDYTL